MAMLVGEQSPRRKLSTDHVTIQELVIGCHNKMSTTGKVAMTKWCPQETTDKSFERAEGAVDLALRRMNQEKIELLQCPSS